jgi:PDZ domain-containing protein
MFLIFLLCTYELPYYIEAPGGLLDVKDRVYVSSSNQVSGSLNLAYVSEFKATIPTLIYSYFNKDWKLVAKEEIIASNESIEENEYRNQLLLTESQNNAVIVGFNLAGENVEIKNRKLYVTYVSTSSSTDLKIGDEIISINGIKINKKQDIIDILKENDTFNIEVINENKRYIRNALKKDDVIGIVVSEIKEVITDKTVEFKFKDSESGPSGGFMMALSIYNYLTEEDITHNLKIVGTGTILEDGSVGAIGGVEYKIKSAAKQKADIFFVPIENFEEALKVKNENNLNINLVSVSTIEDAINYLKEI